MNLQLASTEEWVDGTFSGNLGEVMIRCVSTRRLRPASQPADGAALPAVSAPFPSLSKPRCFLWRTGATTCCTFAACPTRIKRRLCDIVVHNLYKCHNPTTAKAEALYDLRRTTPEL